MRITEQTTLAELSIERALLGIERLAFEPVRHGKSRIAIAFADGQVLFGHGPTEAEAINEVFARRREQLVDQYVKEP